MDRPAWRVVGGGDKGGIVVRDGQKLSAAEAPSRLATGALVSELELSGERMHYELLAGSGPEQGWVSLKLKDKDLLVGVDEPERGPFDADRLVEAYKGGKLDVVIARYRKLLGTMPNGPPMAVPRDGGAPAPWEGYAPVADPKGRPKIVFSGDQLTHGPPLNVTAAYVAAIAQKNPSVLVENAGWAAALSVTLVEPQDFHLSLPRPGEYGAQYVCILVGTNDAMAMCGPEAYVDTSYVGPPGGAARLPQDWRTACPPSPELFERSVAALVRRHKEAGARVALATPPPLGEDLTEDIPEKHSKKLRRSPFAVVSELAAAARRVAEAEGCALLPFFECACHFLGRLAREPIIWTPQGFGVRFNAGMAARRHEAEKGLPPRLFAEFGAVNGRPEFCYDLVHLNEDGAALFAALVQAWLDSELAAGDHA